MTYDELFYYYWKMYGCSIDDYIGCNYSKMLHAMCNNVNILDFEEE